MRQARKNKSILYYATFVESEPIYALDENGHKIVVETIDGVDYYEEIGQKEASYSYPVQFLGTIKRGGVSEATEFGVDVSQYDAIMVLPTKSSPIDEKSLIWEHTASCSDGISTADYRVDKKVKAINNTLFGLTRLNQ